MKRGKRIKRSKKSEEGILSYEIINNTEESSLDLKNTEEKKPEEQKQEVVKTNKKSIKTLVFLIIILILIDLIFLFVYFKPDMKSILANFFKPKVVGDVSNNIQKCKDGTPYNKCATNKPYYCYNGELLKSAYNCGCPAGYKVDFQDCKKI